MNRIEKWYDSLRKEFSDSGIAAGIGNGDIEKPQWLSIAESTDHVKIWDNETGADQTWGFIKVNYDD